MNGTTITLKGITQKGKNRVREHGALWIVVDDSKTRRGNEVLIESVTGTDGRWIKMENDPNFEVTVTTQDGQ